jgi:hypothetical protein
MNWIPDGKLPDEVSAHPGWQRLEDQRIWYGEKSAHNQRRYLHIKVTQIVLASAIPLLALIEASWGRWLTAGAGAVIAVLEALQQLNQYSRLWIEYRAMAERLKREKYLFLAGTGPYQGLDMEARLATLAMRVEDLVSTEHERWMANVTQAVADKPGSTPPPIGVPSPTH